MAARVTDERRRAEAGGHTESQRNEAQDDAELHHGELHEAVHRGQQRLRPARLRDAPLIHLNTTKQGFAIESGRAAVAQSKQNSIF